MGRGLLIIVSGLFIVYGVIQNSLNQRQKTVTQYSANYATETKSEIIANSMADLAFAEINEAPGDDQAGNFPEINILDGKGSVDVQANVTDPDNPFLRYKILTATGIFNQDTSQVVVKIKRRPFSKYSYFTVIEPTIYFTDGDILNGPVHTNGTIHVNGDAVFNGNVTAAGGCDGCENHNEQFNGERDLDAEEINLPVEVPELANEASNGGLRFTDPVKVDFLNDSSTDEEGGKANISTGTRTCVQYCWSDRHAKYETSWNSPVEYDLDDYNGIISSSEKMEVKGTLNGDVTVHSEKDIEIMGDVRYDHKENPPEEPDPENEDFLGIVSEGQTIVDKDAHKAEGSEDLDIHASIMAMGDDDSFMVEEYDEGSERGYLNILGGLIQHTRGPVGQGSSYGGHSGFLKNYTYDERFLGRSPRGFPRSDIYDFVTWEIKY